MATPDLRILLAERGFTETGVTLRALCEQTGRSLELYVVSKRADLLHALQRYGPDAALLDLSLLQPDPPAAIGVLHQNTSPTPLIVFAEAADKDCAVMCLQTGAKDYMLEGFMDVRTLGRVLRAAICGPLPESQTASSRDLLWGLPTRASAPPDAAPGFHSWSHSGGRLMIAVAVDNLEVIQAHGGAAAADRVLQGLAAVLQKSVRSFDVVTPVASSHSVLIVLDAGDCHLPRINRRIKACVEQYQRSSPVGVPLQLSLVVRFAPDAAPPAIHEFMKNLPGLKRRPGFLPDACSG